MDQTYRLYGPRDAPFLGRLGHTMSQVLLHDDSRTTVHQVRFASAAFASAAFASAAFASAVFAFSSSLTSWRAISSIFLFSSLT
mmetsp:Transcript_47967/g.95735  ORF Transcript_47967/g.95735 Transcript_47967/m.95735 type:complete len:84 (+) Transcript_47967:353-604(+)